MTAGQGDGPRADMRASDADRERVADRLRGNAAEGHITLDELSGLLSRAYAARTYGELDTVLAKLPVPAGGKPGAAPAQGRAPDDRGLWWRIGLGPYLVINTMLIVIWAITGAGYFWPIWPLLGWGACLALAAVGGRGPHGHGPHGRGPHGHRGHGHGDG